MTKKLPAKKNIIINKKKALQQQKQKKKKKVSKKPLTDAQKRRAEERKQREAERIALKKQKKQAAIEAERKRREEAREKKRERAEQNRLKAIEMKRKKKAKAEEQKQKRFELLLVKKEKERLRKIAEQERKKAQQEVERKKKEDEVEKEKEQKRIFKIAEKAVKNGELSFDAGSLMISSETELSFSNLSQQDSAVDPQINFSMTAVTTTNAQQQQVKQQQQTLAEQSLLKLSPEQLSNLGIDKKALARSVSAAVAARNRPPSERCCVCEDGCKASNVSRKQQQFLLSISCSECKRPVHKTCCHSALIRGMDIDQAIEDALAQAAVEKTFTAAVSSSLSPPQPETQEENLFETLGLDDDDNNGDDDAAVATSLKPQQNVNGDDQQHQHQQKVTASKSSTISVSVQVHCVVCRSGKMDHRFITEEICNNSTAKEDDAHATTSPNQQIVNLSPPQEAYSQSHNDAQDVVPLSPLDLDQQQQQQQLPPSSQQQQNQNAVPQNTTTIAAAVTMTSHKYDFQAINTLRQLIAKLSMSQQNNIKTNTIDLLSVANQLTARLLHDGFVVVPLRLLYDGEDSRVESFVQQQHARCMQLLNGFLKAYEIMLNHEGQAPSLEGGFSNFRERGTGRYEMIHEELLENPVSDFIENLAGGRNNQQNLISMIFDKVFMKSQYNRISSGCFIAESGAAKQNWHTDGPSLALPQHMDLLPYALNVFIPLIDVDSSNGTCFLPGSHLDSSIEGPESLTGSGRERFSGMFTAPKIASGDALIFDYRVWHRGLGNSGSKTRPVVYATYSPPWFVDSQNFSQSRYKKKLFPAF